MRTLRMMTVLFLIGLLATGCGGVRKDRETRLLHSRQAVALALGVDESALDGLGVESNPGADIACLDVCPSATIRLPLRNEAHPEWEPSAVLKRLEAAGYVLTSAHQYGSTAPPLSTSGPQAASACVSLLAEAAQCRLSGKLALVQLSAADTGRFAIVATGEE